MSSDSFQIQAGADFLAGNGEMTELIRSKDWSRTPLGPIADWPQSLRTTVSLCLASNFPINIIWGPGNAQIYNDGYRVVCGDAHPQALGQDYSVTWASAWPAIGDPFTRALAADTSFLENQRMFLTRNGYLEESFFTFSLSAIRDESGGIGGLFHPVTETTATILAERRTRALRDLTASLADATSVTDLASLAIETLAPFEYDLPFLLFYGLSDDSAGYRLVGQQGMAPATNVSPLALPIDATAPWPIRGEDGGVVELSGVSTRFRGIKCGPYDEPPNHAFILPIGVSGDELPPMILIAGVSPRLPVTEIYRGFYELLGAALSAALRVVRARENERHRAEASERERLLELALESERNRAQLDATEQQLDVERKVNRVLDARVHERTARLTESIERMHLLEQITRAIGQRQDVSSILQVAVSALEDRLPADFVAIGRCDQPGAALTIAHVGALSTPLGRAIGITRNGQVTIEGEGLAQAAAGALVHEPDLSEVDFPFSRKLAEQGLHSLVLAPVMIEEAVFGILVVARRTSHAFFSSDCEFLKQLAEHVGLAVHQAQLRDNLQRAYDDLKQTQQSVIEQERLRAIGQMASGIAHDINNAISPVAIYTQSLLERDLEHPKEVRDYLEIVGRVVKDVAATVARMRDFYRPEDGKVEFKPVDLNALVPQVVDLTRARWNDMPQQRGVVIQVVTELADDLPSIMGNATELRELSTNLIFNAVDAMPDGGTLTIRTLVVRDGDDEARVRLEVGDSGVGMDAQTRRRCLEPFFTTKGERGTGLGLPMVQGAAIRHKARLDIDTAPGQGARFRLDFVAVEAERPSSEPPKQRGVRALRLLLVDDDPSVLKSTAFVLKLSGHNVTAAPGGGEGIEALREARESGSGFDAVITDLGMPHVDGNRVAAAVKELFPTLPVILLTGWGRRMASGDDAPAHVDYVLPKPLDLAQLREILAQL